jgi:thiamine biosynthesis lipoprotein ApbE
MKFTKELCGSRLEILIHQEWEFSDLIQECFQIWIDFENKYSRFIKWNYLYNLNKNKISHIDDEFYGILKLCLKISDITDWYFDITIQPILEQLWYWIEEHTNKKYNIWYKNIDLSSEKIILNNWVSIDIWSVWKWYIVDKIYNLLNKNFDKFSINFWWDIRIKWEQEIKLEDPNNIDKNIWYSKISNISISSSSWNKRIFWNSHHLINAKNKSSENKVQAVFIQHKLTVFSDIFSTALYVTPIEKSIEILSSISWLEWMIIDNKWRIYKSNWFEYKV